MSLAARTESPLANASMAYEQINFSILEVIWKTQRNQLMADYNKSGKVKTRHEVHPPLHNIPSLCHDTP